MALRNLCLLLALTTLACAPATERGQDRVVRDERAWPTPYLVEEREEPRPALDSESRASIVARALERVLSLDPAGILSFYGEMTALGLPEEGCPSVTIGDETAAWEGDCTTSTGVTFTGSASLTNTVGEPLDEGEGTFDELSLDSDAFSIKAPDGRALKGSFVAIRTSAIHADDYEEATVSIDGEIVGQGVGADDHPILSGVIHARRLSALAAHTPSTASKQLSLSGVLVVPEGDVVITNVVVSDPGSSSCAEGQAVGSVSLRDDNAWWYDLELDDAVVGKASGYGQCRRCAPTFFRGDPIEPTCFLEHNNFVDALLNWEVSPW